MRYLIFAVLVFFCSCEANTEHLPVLSNPNFPNDTNKLLIQQFSFIDQDSTIVTNETFANKIYVADFIFLSCPTICPIMNVEMLKVYKAFEKNEDVLFLAHTIDSLNDTIPRLKEFAKSIGVTSSRWHFVTGNTDSIYKMATESYLTAAAADSTAEGNFAHGGGLVLVDGYKRIRGVYDGTDSLETKRLIKDIKILLMENARH